MYARKNKEVYIWKSDKTKVWCPKMFYEIERERFYDKEDTIDSWLAHLRNKTWFDSVSESSFLQAFYNMENSNKS